MSAIAWRRLTAVDLNHDANNLETWASPHFGATFEEARTWTIQYVEDDTDEEPSDDGFNEW